MNLSEYFENLIVEWVRGTNFPASPTTLYLALSNTDPLDDGTGLLEPNVSFGYARQPISFGSMVTVPGDSTKVTSQAAVTFGPGVMTDWPPLAFGAIFDDANNMLFYGPLTNQRVVVVGDSLMLDAGALQLELTLQFSTYLAGVIFDWLNGVASAPAPTRTDLCLSTQDPKEDGTGLMEVNNTFNYTRQAITFGFPNFVSGIGTTIDQSTLILFGPATLADWPSVTHGAIRDQNDNQIFQGPLAKPHTLVVDDTLPIPPGSINILVK